MEDRFGVVRRNFKMHGLISVVELSKSSKRLQRVQTSTPRIVSEAYSVFSTTQTVSQSCSHTLSVLHRTLSRIAKFPSQSAYHRIVDSPDCAHTDVPFAFSNTAFA